MENEVWLAKLYDREEAVLHDLSAEYGRAARAIAFRILENRADAEECENEALLRLWNSIPPQKPDSVRAFYFRIVRNLAIDRYRAQNGKNTCSLDELGDVLPAETDDAVEQKALTQAINAFLSEQPKKNRVAFVRRYFYGWSVAEIARGAGMRENTVSALLYRMRRSLQEYLEKRGILS